MDSLALGGWSHFSTSEFACPYVIEPDSLDGVFIGTQHGLFHFDGKTNWNRIYTGNSKLTTNFITAIKNTAKGLIIGTNQGVFISKNNGDWIRFHQLNSNLTCDIITDLALQNQYLWITSPRGVFRTKIEW